MGKVEDFHFQENLNHYEIIQIFENIVLIVERNSEKPETLTGVYHGHDWAPDGYEKLADSFWVSYSNPLPAR